MTDLRECEVYAVLQGNTFGMTFQQLWGECLEYGEEVELSRDLGSLLKANLIQKHGNEYWDINAKLPNGEPKVKKQKKPKKEKPYNAAVEEEGFFDCDLDVDDKPINRPNAPVETTKLKEVGKPYMTYKEPDSEPTPEVFEKKRGALHRTNIQTKVALTMYFTPDKVWTIPEIRAKLQVAYQSCYGFMKKMLKDGYIDQVGDGYTWSGRYKYPFQMTMPGDEAWATLKIVTPSITTLPTTFTVPTETIKPNLIAPEVNPNTILEGIDSVIARYEKELASLRFVRSNFLSSILFGTNNEE